MSGGQQQRVALARALVIKPGVLLLDEPLSNLDAKLREEMQVELRQIQRTLGTTTILVTHDQSEAMALADRIVVMNQGRVEQIGTPPTRSISGPRRAVRRQFPRQDQRACRRRSTGTRPASAARHGAAPAAPTGRSWRRVRPERIAFAEAGGVAGIVRARIFQGNHWLLQVATEGGLVHGDPPERRPAAAGRGSAVRLVWRADDMTFAPPRTAHDEPDRDGMRRSRARSCCAGPALLLFVGAVLVPIAMTVLLSFHEWGQYKGIEPVYHPEELARDRHRSAISSRFSAHVPHRAAGHRWSQSLIGTPEAYILSRMAPPWRGLFLLVVLGPLLISVVARTLGWALLFGADGLVNKAAAVARPHRVADAA